MGTMYRRRVFALSLGDWLDPKVPIEWLARMLDIIRRCEHLDFLLVTKRPELFEDRLYRGVAAWLNYKDERPLTSEEWAFAAWLSQWLHGKPPQNVWIVVSAENQEMADLRLPQLLKIPALIRGLSCEPLLGPLDLSMALEDFQPLNPDLARKASPVQWIIVGGESGPKARPCKVEWIRSIKSQCEAAGVACFVKQLGSDPRQDLSAVIPEADITDPELEPADIGAWEAHRHAAQMFLKHSKGGDPAEWSNDLRVREFPEVKRL